MLLLDKLQSQGQSAAAQLGGPLHHWPRVALAGQCSELSRSAMALQIHPAKCATLQHTLPNVLP